MVIGGHGPSTDSRGPQLAGSSLLYNAAAAQRMNWHRGVGLLCLLLAGVRTLVATPAALSSGPLAYYVDTGAALGTSAACSQDYPQRFTGSGLQTEITRRAPGPIQYLSLIHISEPRD